MFPLSVEGLRLSGSRRVADMWGVMEEDTASSPHCHECKRPLMAIDFYGEHLKGCLSCNVWWTPDDIKKRLSEEDLCALHGMVRHSYRDD